MGEAGAHLTERQELKLARRNVWLGQWVAMCYRLETEWAETESVRGQMLISYVFGHETSREAREASK